MDRYHKNKIFFYVLLSVALHAGVLYAFFYKEHGISGLMGSLGGFNHGEYNEVEEHNILDEGVNIIEETNARLDTKPESNTRANQKSIEIVNIQTKKSKPSPKPKNPNPVAKKIDPKPQKEEHIEEKVAENQMVEESIEKVVEEQVAKETNNQEIDTQNLVASEREPFPEIIDLDPSEQDVMVIEESEKPDQTKVAEVNPRIEIPKQLPKLEQKDEDALSWPEGKSKAYDDSDDNLLGFGPGNIANSKKPDNDNFVFPDNRAGAPDAGMLNEGVTEGMHGSQEIPGGMGTPGEMGVPGGMHNGGMKIFREGEIVPLVNATPIDYPKESIELREEGTVRMNLQFDKFGHLVDGKITKSSGFLRLDEAAEKSVSRMRFRATGFPFIYQANFNFELEKNQ